MQRFEIYLGGDNKTGMRQHAMAVCRVLDKFESAYTLIAATGVWGGRMEGTWQILIYSDGARIREIARALCAEFDQSCVLVGFPDGSGETIGREG